jgi:DNA sulfur modification protein DndB
VSYIFPALQGRMGSTDYYQATVRARELAAVAKMAGELPEWTSWSVFERFQRELAETRVQKEIIPYLARTKDRFFNSLIVLVYEPADFTFETIEEAVGKLPLAYRDVASQMGFLTINGGELVVLDGQHRLSALRGITTAGNEVHGEYVNAVADDELCVIFVRHESFEKTRRIFNKVNRYAKPTSPTDNIITSEDDGSAIVARWLVEPKPPLGLAGPKPPLSGLDTTGEPIVEWRRPTLGQNDRKFTTLSALYQMTQIILASNGMTNFNEKHMVNRPSDRELVKAYTLVAAWWKTVLAGFTPFKRGLQRPYLLPDYRSFQASYSLLFRPIGQIAFTHALCGATQLGMSLEEAVEAAEDAGWSASDEVFCDTVIYANGHMAANEARIRLAGRVGTYLIAWESMSKEAIGALSRDLADAKGLVRYQLP